tara:strand:- start:231 stop:962 length:732 start_codon:yes stop_codon:yes gene_type:complete
LSNFARGKKAFGISDRSGFRYRLKDMRKEWNGLLVGKDEYEEKHPQLEPFGKAADAQALRNARPETNLLEQRSIQHGFNPVGFREISGITPPNNLVGNGSVGFVSISFVNNSNTSSTTGTSSSASLGSVTVSTNVTTYIVTVQGGKFYIDGSQTPTLTLNEGSIYRFDQSDSTNSNHPLRFSTTSDGTHGGGSAYTTGVTVVTGASGPGSSGAYTQITVASGAPTLYYYCTNHSGMGGQANTP